MTENPHTARRPSDAINNARAVTDAMELLCRTTHPGHDLTPADVSAVLAHLAAAVPALAQAARQLSNILRKSAHDQNLTTDEMMPTADPVHPVEAARRHLDVIDEPARELHRLLDAAHNETAHIATTHRASPETVVSEPIAPPPRDSGPARAHPPFPTGRRIGPGPSR